MTQNSSYEFEQRSVRLSFRLGEVPLFFKTFDLDVFAFSLERLLEGSPPLDQVPRGRTEGSDGLVYRSALAEQELSRVKRIGEYVRYVPSRFTRYYIDLSESWEAYLTHFSGKTRSTLRRKARRFAETSGGEIDWREYRTRDEMKTFYDMARTVSAKTYQERLLRVGLPDDEVFEANILDRAESGKVLGFLLFLDAQPVSYLYLPVEAETVLYAHLGYDPETSKHSPGSVLFWLALERLFSDPGYRYFDFLEGDSEHKRLFSDHQVNCADIYFLKASISNRFWILLHEATFQLSRKIGNTLDKLGLKQAVKRLIRWTARS